MKSTDTKTIHQPHLTIAIVGASGSGKSYLCDRLAGEFSNRGGSAVVRQDNYYRDLGDLTIEERAKNNFDHPNALDGELLASHLLALKSGKSIETPCYDFSTHSRTSATELLHPQPLIIVEGTMLLALEAVGYVCDITIYVETPLDLCLARRLTRDVVHRGRETSAILSQYLNQVRPMYYQYVAPQRDLAHLVVDGTEDIDALYQRVSTFLSQRQQQ